MAEIAVLARAVVERVQGDALTCEHVSYVDGPCTSTAVWRIFFERDANEIETVLSCGRHLRRQVRFAISFTLPDRVADSD